LNLAIQFGEGVPEQVAVPGILNGLKLVQDALPRQLQPLKTVELIHLTRGPARLGPELLSAVSAGCASTDLLSHPRAMPLIIRKVNRGNSVAALKRVLSQARTVAPWTRRR
jgi:hypothetical protein